MDNQIPGLFLEETAGIALLFWLLYVLLLGSLWYLIVKKGKTWWLLPEGLLVCLLADRFRNRYTGECYRLTMEWEFYIRRWTKSVALLSGLVVYGAVLLYVRRGKRDRCTGLWFLGGAAAALFLRTVI